MFAVRMLLIPLMIIGLSGASPEAFAAQGVKIEKVGVGTVVKVTRAGAVLRLKEGDPLQSGDEINTDAQTAADIRLEDETLIRLGVSSSYKVEESSKFLSLIHRLITGVVRIQVPKSESKASEIKFRLYTPEGTIGVRGTEFVVTRNSAGTELRGIDGEVLFGPADADFAQAENFVQVRRGFYSVVKAGGKANKPEKFNLGEYLQQINGASGVFGPLSGKAPPVKTYARTKSPGSQPAAPAAPSATGASKPAATVASNVGGGKSNDNHVNWQKRLYDAVLAGNVEKLKEAIQKGADVNKPEVGYTPLQMAITEAEKKDVEVLTTLLQNGADPNQPNNKGYTPLMMLGRGMFDMSQDKAMEYARALVDPGGADIEAKNKKDGNKTAADYATDNNFKELADYLLGDEAAADQLRAMEAKAAEEKEKKKKGK